MIYIYTHFINNYLHSLFIFPYNIGKLYQDIRDRKNGTFEISKSCWSGGLQHIGLFTG